MKGVIRTREKCAHCGGKFVEGYIGREPDLVCSCGRTPRTYYIYLYVSGVGDKKITQDREGKQLDSYKRANRLLERIRSEMDAKTFDIYDYLVKTKKQFHPHPLILRWYKSKCKQKLAPTTLRDIKSHIRNYFSPITQKMGLTDCRDIRTHHIDTFFESLPARSLVTGLPLSLKTKDNIMTNLGSFINWLKRKEILERNPEFPKIEVPEPPIEWLPKDVLLKALPFVPEHDRPVIHFMLYHPLRSGEVCALKVKDFNLAERTIHVCRAKSLNQIRSRKNKKPYYITISDSFCRTTLSKKLPEAFAFFNSVGHPYSSNHLKKIWRNACEKAKIKYIPLKNASRHSIASQAINRGVDLNKVSMALGHSSLDVTRRRYAKLEVAAIGEVIDAPVVEIRKVIDGGGK